MRNKFLAINSDFIFGLLHACDGIAVLSVTHSTHLTVSQCRRLDFPQNIFLMRTKHSGARNNRSVSTAMHLAAREYEIHIDRQAL